MHSWEPQQSIYRICSRNFGFAGGKCKFVRSVGWLKQAAAEAIVCFAASTAWKPCQEGRPLCVIIATINNCLNTAVDLKRKKTMFSTIIAKYYVKNVIFQNNKKRGNNKKNQKKIGEHFLILDTILTNQYREHKFCAYKGTIIEFVTTLVGLNYHLRVGLRICSCMLSRYFVAYPPEELSSAESSSYGKQFRIYWFVQKFDSTWGIQFPRVQFLWYVTHSHTSTVLIRKTFSS